VVSLSDKVKPAILMEKTVTNKLGTVRSKECGVQREGNIRNWETLIVGVGDSRYI
jgi:hypothetical protein